MVRSPDFRTVENQGMHHVSSKMHLLSSETKYYVRGSMQHRAETGMRGRIDCVALYHEGE